MRHHSEDIIRRSAANSCNVIAGTVRVGLRGRLTAGIGVAEDNPALRDKPLIGGIVADIAALAVRDRDLQNVRPFRTGG